MSTRFKVVAGYVVAGGVLILAADYSPQFAIGTASIVALAVLLKHADNITALANIWKEALG